MSYKLHAVFLRAISGRRTEDDQGVNSVGNLDDLSLISVKQNVQSSICMVVICCLLVNTADICNS